MSIQQTDPNEEHGRDGARTAPPGAVPRSSGTVPVRVTRTYLEMRSRDALRRAPRPDERAAVVREACDAALYRRLYGAVGRDFHWRDRDRWTDEHLEAHLTQPHVGVWVLRVHGEPAGYFELVRHADRSVEIAYFGLMSAYIGRGLGKYLLSCAVDEAWALGAERVWLHTCTLDHLAALPNYVARGFHAFLTEMYVAEVPVA